MASVNITVDSARGRFDISMEYPEAFDEAWGGSVSHLDSLLDKAVASVKRAYGSREVKEATND